MHSSSTPSYPEFVSARQRSAFAHRESEKATVLCVDDEPLILASLDYQLREEFCVLCAPDGATALQMLENQLDVSVVLSDLRMRSMDGLTFLTEVRALRPRVVTMLITGALHDADLRATVSRFGISRVLSKPCTADELREAVRSGVDTYRSADSD